MSDRVTDAQIEEVCEAVRLPGWTTEDGTKYVDVVKSLAAERDRADWCQTVMTVASGQAQSSSRRADLAESKLSVAWDQGYRAGQMALISDPHTPDWVTYANPYDGPTS